MREAPAYILLATFEGARFLQIQLDSLYAQSDSNWVLLARDDGSCDHTAEILRCAAAQDRRITLIHDELGRLGAQASFFALMRLALEQGAQWFALCDQDDVWSVDKLARQRDALAQLQARAGSQSPLLVYSDLEWIDAGGQRIADSHFIRAGLTPAREGPGSWLLAMNAVPGCAMAGNRRLLELACPAPAAVVHHDWWLILLASACGQVGYVDEALVGYRQHSANAIGARSLWRRAGECLRAPRSVLSRALRVHRQAVWQAAALQQRVGDAMHPDWQNACRAVREQLASRMPWRRCLAVVRGPVRRIGYARNVLMLFAALLSPPDSPPPR